MKTNNKELAEAVVKLSRLVATMIKMNVTVAKIAVPLATHLSESDKQRLLAELNQVPAMAEEIRRTCEYLMGSGQENYEKHKIEMPAIRADRINIEDISLEPEYEKLASLAKAGDVESQFRMGELFEKKVEVEASDHLIKAAAYWFQKAAEQGLSAAQYKVAMTYQWERVFPDKKVEMVDWCQKAAEQGYAPAQLELASIFHDGYWIDSADDKKAELWFRKAAAQKVPDAQFKLAEFLEEKNSSEAVQIFLQLAESGYKEAQVKLAELFQEGKHVPQNDSKSFAWYLRAAEGGESRAFTEVGRGYLFGNGVPKNVTRGAEWLVKIADPKTTVDCWNMDFAQHMLYLAYADIENPNRDLVEAYKWLNLSITYNNHEDLRTRLKEERKQLALNMTQDQVKEAQRRSSELFIPDDEIIHRIRKSQQI